MANGYNPYLVAETEKGFLESILASEEAQKQGVFSTGEQKGEMIEEFEEEDIKNKKAIERILQEQSKNKGGFLKLLSSFTDPVTSAVISGLVDTYNLKKRGDFAKEQITKAEQFKINPRWLKTFVGSQARDISSKTDIMLERMKSDAKVSGKNLLTSLVGGAVTGYATGKMGENIAKQFAPQAKMIKPESANFKDFTIGGTEGTTIGGTGDLDLMLDSPATRTSGVTISPITDKAVDWDALDKGLSTSDKGFFEKIFAGLGETDITKLFKSDNKGGNILRNLLMMLELVGGDR